jgi:adenylate kinase family enzyme
MKRNQVVLIYGLPASGKYTVAQKVQEKCGGILLDNHYFYDMFLGMTEDTDERWHEYIHCVGDVRKNFLDVIRKFYPKKKPIRYIFTGVYLRGEKGPARLRKFAQDINADFIPIELQVSKEKLLERCDTEQRKQRKKLHNKEKYNNMLNDWLPLVFHSRSPNKLVINSSELTLEETFAKVKKHLKQFD